MSRAVKDPHAPRYFGGFLLIWCMGGAVDSNQGLNPGRVLRDEGWHVYYTSHLHYSGPYRTLALAKAEVRAFHSRPGRVWKKNGFRA